MKTAFCAMIVLLIDAELLEGKTRQKAFHRVIKEPVDEVCPLKKMEAVSCVDHRTGMRVVGGKASHDATHRSVAVNQRKGFVSHHLAELAENFDVGWIKRTADEINLVADDSSSIKAMVVIAVRWHVVVCGVMNFIAHFLKDPNIVHLKLRDKSAHRSDEKCLLFCIGSSCIAHVYRT